MIFTFVQKRH